MKKQEKIVHKAQCSQLYTATVTLQYSWLLRKCAQASRVTDRREKKKKISRRRNRKKKK